MIRLMISGLLVCWMTSLGAVAFVTRQSKPACFLVPQTTTSLFALYNNVDDVGYSTRVSKPMGVIFSENPDPYYGLVVEDVEPGTNGGMAGMRIGDNLVAINGQSVVGDDFDTVMGMLVATEGDLELQLYRGSAPSLFAILSNKGGGLDQEEAEDSEEAVVMDENYETTVRVEVEEEKPLTAGDVFNAFKKVGSMLTEDVKKEATPKEEKKKGGLFGGLFSQETIQLEGDDASGLKGQNRK